jgi:hypothetical protein
MIEDRSMSASEVSVTQWRPDLRWLAGALLLLAALSAPLFLGNYALHAIIVAMIFLLPAQGLNLLVGYTGLLSLAQAAFFGIGAYTSALMAIHFGTPFYISFVAAGAVAGAVALPLGVPALRLRATSFVMCTLGFVVIGQAVAKNWVSLTRGDMGLSSVPKPVFDFGLLSFKMAADRARMHLKSRSVERLQAELLHRQSASISGFSYAPDRRLRADRRLRDRGPGRVGRLDRLAMPAEVRLRQLLCKAARIGRERLLAACGCQAARGGTALPRRHADP